MSTLRYLMQAIGTRCHYGQLPDAYLVIDVETSGLLGSINPNGKPACIAQFGVAAVRGRQIVSREAFLVQRPPGTMQAGATAVNKITDEMLATKGEPPSTFYPRLINLLMLYREMHCPYVGHNAIGFDRSFINIDIKQSGFDFEIQPHEVIDTGMIYKASQLCVAPCDNESLTEFLDRVCNTWSHVKWNLVLAIQTLHLDTKFSLDIEDAHDASYDCLMTHLLFEELRQLADGAPNGF